MFGARLDGKGIGALVGAVLTFAVMYLAVVGTYVTRADVSRMIEVESPYVQDAKWIREKLGNMDKKLDTLLATPTDE